MTGAALDNEAQALGTQRLPAVGASGTVTITSSAAGCTIFAGDLFIIGANTYQCTQTGGYSSTNPVPIVGVSTGPGTNQNAGTVGNWQVPRPGCAQSATVTAAADGSGLSGGHNLESDAELRARLNFLAANPPASGNDADIQTLASRCPGLSVEQVFTYPCIQGPGSTSVCFTLRASSAGGNRVPNNTQIALMSAWLQGPGQLPADLSITVCPINQQSVPMVLRPVWATTAPNWTDASPWPAFTSIGSEPQIAAPSSGTTSPTYFRIINAATAPSVGQNVAMYDGVNRVFRQKRILSFTTDGAGGYDITVDTSQGVSDTSYTPQVGQFVGPWSDSLQTLVTPVLTYMATLGPGEMIATFPDPGSRQRRNPQSPALFPSTLSVRILAGPASQPFVAYGQQPAPPVPTLANLTSLLDVAITEPVLPLVPTVGGPAVYTYMITLGDLSAYP